MPSPLASRRRFLSTTVIAAVAALGQTPRRLLADDAPAADEAETIPFLEPQPYDPKRPMLRWDQLNITSDWLTPTPSVYHVSHYGEPKLDAANYQLQFAGLVDRPITYTLDQLKRMPRKELVATLECGGNGSSPGFRGAIANVKWAGTPLAPLLKEANLSPDAVEIAFWGRDRGKEKIRGGDYEQHFARCLSIQSATRDDILLCYEMNQQPLTPGHGFPLRLVVPGHFGIAWVKWLDRIEARDLPLKTRFMARDYVTLRGVEVDGKIIWKESLVGPMIVKSVVARVVKMKDGALRLTGAAWGQSPVKTVEVSIDNGPWQPARILQRNEPFTWRFWSYDWQNPTPGQHTLVSRAIDARGRIQPAMDDPAIKLKKTYWEANGQWARRIKL